MKRAQHNRYFSIGSEENHEHFSKDVISPDQDTKLGPSERETGLELVPTQRRGSVDCFLNELRNLVYLRLYSPCEFWPLLSLLNFLHSR